MKIDARSPQVATPDVTRVKKGAKAAPVEQTQQTKVQLTDQVKVLGKKAMVADVGGLQAVQDMKVQAVKTQVAAGNYQVGGRDIAEKMLSRSTRGKG